MDPIHVLLVEDSETDAKLVAIELRRTGRAFDVERVETDDEMRAALGRRRWDVVLSDWTMPQFSALAALRLLQDMGMDLPFIIVSGTIGEDTAVDAMRAGAHDYVLKGKLTRLGAAVEREIRESRVRKEARLSHGALLASEARYRRIVETTNQGVWMLDAQGRTTFMNERMAAMVGYDCEEVRGLPVLGFVDEAWRDEAVRNLARGRSGPAQIESKLRRKDGSGVWALLETAPTLDAFGNYDGSFAMVMDVTERRKSEEALRLSESRLRRLWDSGLLLISIADARGKIQDINEAGAAMLGYTREELLAGVVRWNEITPPEWQAVDAIAQAQLKATGVTPPWEKELLRKDGGRLAILAAAATLDDGHGIYIGVDVTERRLAQTDLLERVRIAALAAEVGMALAQGDPLPEMLGRCMTAIVTHLDAARACVWILDGKTNTLDLRGGAGLDVEVDQAPPGAGPRFDLAFITDTREPHVTNDLSHDSGMLDLAWATREGIVGFAGYPLLVAGQLVGVLALFTRQPWSDPVLNGLGTLADTIANGVQRKAAEQAGLMLETQLRQAQKMEAVGRLAGGIAHDFNNVLSVILSLSDMMLHDLKTGDPLRHDVREIHTAGIRAASLTRQLLLFSRQQVIEPVVLDLNGLLADMDRMLQRLVGADVELTLIPGESVGRVLVDPGSIEQVIMNLAVNARDAMPTGGKLTMETVDVELDAEFARNHLGAKMGSYVMFSVTDTGVGMDKATLARIFDPFFTTKEVGKGTGLGLSTVFGIVQQCGGNIWVYSEPGLGTAFKIYLPRVDAPAEAARPLNVPTTLRGSETILLVEDEAQVRAVARGILLRHGYTVLEAGHAGEAILLCESHPGTIHLLLSDVVMPGMSGPELARRLVQVRPGTRVLCMSGYTDDTAVRHGVIDAALAYLQKPITVESLTRKVREVLDAGRDAGD
jgi:two-component system cell cycle sensor histidine kinase/response regulator CckA